MDEGPLDVICIGRSSVDLYGRHVGGAQSTDRYGRLLRYRRRVRDKAA